MKHALIGIAGTFATVELTTVNQGIAAGAGLLTCVWMLRQIYLSFYPNEKNPSRGPQSRR